jgi:hypothetical protein
MNDPASIGHGKLGCAAASMTNIKTKDGHENTRWAERPHRVLSVRSFVMVLGMVHIGPP